MAKRSRVEPQCGNDREAYTEAEDTECDVVHRADERAEFAYQHWPENRKGFVLQVVPNLPEGRRRRESQCSGLVAPERPSRSCGDEMKADDRQGHYHGRAFLRLIEQRRLRTAIREARHWVLNLVRG